MRSHEEHIVISFGDADPAGIIFYPRLFGLAHHAVENLIRESPLGWAGWFASPDYAAPIRKAEADFILPMASGATFTARARVEAVGKTSVTFAVEFIGARDEVAAVVTSIHVLVDKTTGQPAPLTDAMRRAFAGQEG